MPVSLESSVIKILNAEGRVVGTGFVLTPALAVTCAHVIAAAGGQQGENLLDFPLLPSRPRLTATVAATAAT